MTQLKAESFLFSAVAENRAVEGNLARECRGVEAPSLRLDQDVFQDKQNCEYVYCWG